MKTIGRVLSILILGAALASARAEAQQLILKGEFGLKGGTLGPPGLYSGMIGDIAWADELKTEKGNTIEGPNLTQELFGPLVMYVSEFKIFGANYGALMAIPFANIRLESPTLDVEGSTGLALSQMWVSPLMLGWHFERADLAFHYAFYAPTGRYTPGSPTNTSLGMWANELSLRGTVYLDPEKRWHASASLFYDFNSKKEGLDWKTGNPFTLMWGAGADYGSGKLFKGWAGVVGFAQWQVTPSTGADVPPIMQAGRTQIYGIGPELTTLQGALTIRYFWEFDNRFAVQGPSLFLQFTMPLPL